VERTLLSAAVDVGLAVDSGDRDQLPDQLQDQRKINRKSNRKINRKINRKSKSGGQECPPHTT
jgi:hypothetical protein